MERAFMSDDGEPMSRGAAHELCRQAMHRGHLVLAEDLVRRFGLDRRALAADFGTAIQVGPLSLVRWMAEFLHIGRDAALWHIRRVLPHRVRSPANLDWVLHRFRIGEEDIEPMLVWFSYNGNTRAIDRLMERFTFSDDVLRLSARIGHFRCELPMIKASK